jgi:hypothetical protein
MTVEKNGFPPVEQKIMLKLDFLAYILILRQNIPEEVFIRRDTLNNKTLHLCCDYFFFLF